MENKTDYERAFLKVAQQVRKELGFANDDSKADPKFRDGMLFAYSSIERLITDLENGEFYYLDDEVPEEN